MEELAKRFADLAEKVGPSALDAARGAVRVEVYSVLASSLIQILVATLLIIAGRRLWAWKTNDDFDGWFPPTAASVLFGVAAICSMMAVWNWIDPWTWVAMNNPDLWLAKKVLKI